MPVAVIPSVGWNSILTSNKLLQVYLEQESSVGHFQVSGCKYLELTSLNGIAKSLKSLQICLVWAHSLPGSSACQGDYTCQLSIAEQSLWPLAQLCPLPLCLFILLLHFWHVSLVHIQWASWRWFNILLKGSSAAHMDTLAVEVGPVTFWSFLFTYFRHCNQLKSPQMHCEPKLPETNKFGLLSTGLQCGFKGSFTQHVSIPVFVCHGRWILFSRHWEPLHREVHGMLVSEVKPEEDQKVSKPLNHGESVPTLYISYYDSEAWWG